MAVNKGLLIEPQSYQRIAPVDRDSFRRKRLDQLLCGITRMGTVLKSNGKFMFCLKSQLVFDPFRNADIVAQLSAGVYPFVSGQQFKKLCPGRIPFAVTVNE